MNRHDHLLDALAPGDTSWREQGSCAGVDPDLWYPDRGGDARPAKAICFACPVRARCLQHALDHHERFGIWGGASERDRRRIIRRAVA